MFILPPRNKHTNNNNTTQVPAGGAAVAAGADGFGAGTDAFFSSAGNNLQKSRSQDDELNTSRVRHEEIH